MSPRRLLAMARKESIHIRRDPRSLGLAVGIPMLMLLMFGYALALDVNRVPFVVRDQSATPQPGARRPPDFATRLGAGREAAVQAIVDGADANTAGIVLGYTQAVVAAHQAQIVLEAARRAGGPSPAPSVDLRPRVSFNPDLESRNYYVPGIIAMLVMLVGLMLTSMAIVREKETGTIEQVMVTPIRPVEFILGKCAPFAVVGLVDTALVSAVGLLWFDIPFRGSFALLLLGTAIFLLGTPGIGLFISTVSRTQQRAMLTTFFFFFPAMLFSGFIHPISRMPEAFQWRGLATRSGTSWSSSAAFFSKAWAAADVIPPDDGGRTLAAEAPASRGTIARPRVPGLSRSGFRPGDRGRGRTARRFSSGRRTPDRGPRSRA